MSSTRLFPIEANNLKHIELLDEFDLSHKISTPVGKFRQEQKEKIQSSNDISMELVLEEKEKIEDICHISGYKDMKTCTISFARKNKKNRKIYSMATDYAIKTLGMEEVFISINPEDKDMLDYFASNDYECLGDEKGSIIYLKEKEY